MFVKKLGFFAACLILLSAFPIHSAPVDPAKVLGPDTCGNCHRLEHDVWKKTRHYQLMDTLYKNPMAQQIAQKMGERLIKVDSLCLNCHFTPQLKSGKLSATAGVSCESCHGAAQGWLTIHNDFGGPQATRATETPEHRNQRLTAAQNAGMFVPEQLYTLAGNCFACHTVQNEKLVNTAGHPSGSSFDLVERASKIRHNFVRGGRKSNPEASPERKRIMYLVGWALELEYGLRGAAKATEDGRFLKAMESRVENALDELKTMKGVLNIPELDQILNAAQGVAVKANNQAELMHAVQKISAAGISIAEKNNGKALAALDDLMSAPQEEATTGGGGGTPVKPKVKEGGIASQRPVSKYKTIGPSNCSCHTNQNDWWSKDKHFAAAQPFLSDDPKRVKIARMLGVGPNDMKKGTAICMDCHATVISGKEKREVDEGVSCEHCHGAAGDYLKVHNEGGKFNPKAFDVGMRKLSDLTVRAEVCTGCHYITESKLLSTGHPSNANFDFAAAMDKIKHWKEPNDAGAIKAAFAAQISKRGPVPQVTLLKEEDAPPVIESAPEEGGSKKLAPPPPPPPPPTAKITGQKKSHINPPGKGVIGPGTCGGCHSSQSGWWASDQHNKTAEPFWENKPKNVKIASWYGISADDMKNGNNICMDCHGTVVTGKEGKEVADGVSCENCHGPGAGYLKVHNEGGKFNPKAFQVGMKDLSNLDVRADVCTGCHYITDERLISAGHPAKPSKDYVKAMEKIKHWKGANDVAAINKAIDKALTKRGGVPKVAVVAPIADEEEEDEEPTAASTAGTGSTARPRIFGPEKMPDDLDPLPEIKENISLEELLKIIKKRIELLHPRKEVSK